MRLENKSCPNLGWFGFFVFLLSLCRTYASLPPPLFFKFSFISMSVPLCSQSPVSSMQWWGEFSATRSLNVTRFLEHIRNVGEQNTFKCTCFKFVKKPLSARKFPAVRDRPEAPSPCDATSERRTLALSEPTTPRLSPSRCADHFCAVDTRTLRCFSQLSSLFCINGEEKQVGLEFFPHVFESTEQCSSPLAMQHDRKKKVTVWWEMNESFHRKTRVRRAFKNYF